MRRFDRTADGTPLAQEDFCQLAGKTAANEGKNFKYEGSYEEIAEIVKTHCGAHRIEIEKLFSLIAFNYVIGNGDAHLKNFSLIETPDGDFVVSPAYDLLSTAIHLPSESRTALVFFKDDFETEFFARNGFYGRPDFLELAQRFGMQNQRAEVILGRFQKEEIKVHSLLDRSLLSPTAKEAYRATFADRLRALGTTDVRRVKKG